MRKELRIRNKNIDVEITLLKLLPIIFMLIMLFASTSIGSAIGEGGIPPMVD